jgi:sugar phosphate isomerase/epimerase
MTNSLLSCAWRGLALCAVAALATSTGLAQPRIPDDCKINGFAVGCQAYTFNRFTVFEAIEKTAAAGGKVIEFYPGQKLSKEEPNVGGSHDAADAVVAKVKAKLAQHKVKAVNYGVVSIPTDEAGARKIFEFAKQMGMRAVTTESTGSIDTIEKLVKEYDIAVAYHNHPRQPNSPDYKVWDPNYVLALVKDRDPRIGACADTGHWLRSNLKPVECVRILKGRIVSSHLKDLDKLGEGSHDVPFGTGVADVKAVLDEFKAQGFAGNISIEYEHNWDNSLPEVTQCIDFVKAYRK